MDSQQPQWIVWQLADSGFPTGGFAHSAGLEAASQHGEVGDNAALWRFLRDSLLQTGHAALPLVAAAHRAPERLAELDLTCDGFLINPVANRASRAQGRAFLSACVRTWPCPALDVLAERAPGLCGHHAPLFGATVCALGVPLRTAQALYLHNAGRGVLAAAVRLGIAGPYAAQRLQSRSVVVLNAVLARCEHLSDADIAQSAPLLDLFQSAHDRLYSRLFQS